MPYSFYSCGPKFNMPLGICFETELVETGANATLDWEHFQERSFYVQKSSLYSVQLLPQFTGEKGNCIHFAFISKLIDVELILVWWSWEVGNRSLLSSFI